MQVVIEIIEAMINENAKDMCINRLLSVQFIALKVKDAVLIGECLQMMVFNC